MKKVFWYYIVLLTITMTIQSCGSDWAGRFSDHF